MLPCHHNVAVCVQAGQASMLPRQPMRTQYAARAMVLCRTGSCIGNQARRAATVNNTSTCCTRHGNRASGPNGTVARTCRHGRPPNSPPRGPSAPTHATGGRAAGPRPVEAGRLAHIRRAPLLCLYPDPVPVVLICRAVAMATARAVHRERTCAPGLGALACKNSLPPCASRGRMDGDVEVVPTLATVGAEIVWGYQQRQHGPLTRASG